MDNVARIFDAQTGMLVDLITKTTLTLSPGNLIRQIAEHNHYVQGVNTNKKNSMIAHTTADCSTNGKGQFAQMMSSNCNAGDGSGYPTLGCGSESYNPRSYGRGFNAAGGGVFAFWWNGNSTLSVNFWTRKDIPADIISGDPKPASWPKPGWLLTSESCNIDSHFYDMQMVLNTDFCGGWADALWSNSGWFVSYPMIKLGFFD